MNCSDIKQQAISLADNSSGEIVLKVYQHLINKHESFCNCDYCLILRKYVQAKKDMSFFRRKCEYTEDDFFWELYNNRKTMVNFYKREKNKLKKIPLKYEQNSGS